MQMKRSGRIQYVSVDFGDNSPSLQGFTTKHEGVSRAPYNSLNLGLNTLDQPFNVEGNRSLMARAFDIGQEYLVTVKQVHGTDILLLNEFNEDYSHFLGIESDAIITNQPGVMIGICVADCVPILLSDPEKHVIAAVHAGWQGTANQLVKKTVEAMQAQFGSNPDKILAAVGPSIGQCCYEVDAPVKQSFEHHNLTWKTIAKPNGDGKWLLDLPTANFNLLLQAGLSQASIQSAGMCTSCQKELFFSYRRENGETGRQLGFIMLK